MSSCEVVSVRVRNRTRVAMIFLCYCVCGSGQQVRGQVAEISAAAIIERTVGSVYLVGVVSERGGFHEIGTAWTISPTHLLTNAHVAESLEAIRDLDPGSRIVAKRGFLDRGELVLGEAVIHPAYRTWNPRLRRMLVRTARDLKQFDHISAADVALLEVVVGDPGLALPLISEDPTAEHPELGDEVFYVGYPMENVSGFATLHVVPMRITALTDFLFAHSSGTSAFLLHLAGQTAGGASGSPLVNRRGEVVGVLSAMDAAVLYLADGNQSRVSNGFAYAQSAALIRDLLDTPIARLQAARDREWTARLRGPFLGPQQILDEMIERHTRLSGVDWSDAVLVTERSENLSEQSLTSQTRLRLDGESSYFIGAVAADGSDIDAFLYDDQETLLASDEADDQFPILLFDNRAERMQTTLVVSAAEKLLGPTEVLVKVYRLPLSSDPGEDSYQMSLSRHLAGEYEVLLNEEYVAPRTGDLTHSYTFTIETGYAYTASAVSDERRDIDLVARVNGEVVSVDDYWDHYPTVNVSGREGELTIDLLMPQESRVGETVEVLVYRIQQGSLSSHSERVLHEENYQVESDGAGIYERSFTLDAEGYYSFEADSPDGHDIDLILLQGDRELGRDDLVDSYPIVQVHGIEGECTLRMLLPESIERGDVVRIMVIRSGN